MLQPTQGSELTSDQVAKALNLASFSGAVPKAGSRWHKGPHGGGAFEPWSKDFGYSDCFPIYAHVMVGTKDYHIYYLNDANAAPVILKGGETPASYRIVSKKIPLNPSAPAFVPSGSK